MHAGKRLFPGRDSDSRRLLGQSLYRFNDPCALLNAQFGIGLRSVERCRADSPERCRSEQAPLGSNNRKTPDAYYPTLPDKRRCSASICSNSAYSASVISARSYSS